MRGSQKWVYASDFLRNNRPVRQETTDPDVRPVATDIEMWERLQGRVLEASRGGTGATFLLEKRPAPFISVPIGGTSVNGGRRYTTRAQTPGLYDPTPASDPVHVRFSYRFTNGVLNRATISDTESVPANPRGINPPLHCFVPGKSRGRVPWDGSPSFRIDGSHRDIKIRCTTPFSQRRPHTIRG